MPHILRRTWLFIGCTAFTLTGCQELQAPSEQTATAQIPELRTGITTDRFAIMALQCVHRKYPNKVSHVLAGDEDARPPHALYPAFYGCFDWHSSVHGHWLLTRILKTDANSPMRDAILAALNKSFTQKNIAAETAYYAAEGRASFERPYGIAWYLQLVTELHESDDPQLRRYREILRPLEESIVEQVTGWLPNLAYPIRLGTHNQSAFAFGLMLDYARTVGNKGLENMLIDKTREFYAGDVDCPLAYEPSGEDFLSPCLMEADLMRRVMDSSEYASWLSGFLPSIPSNGSADWLEPGIVRDATDGKLVHLDGVNLSRAWALEGIASALPETDARRTALLAAATKHEKIGIAAVSDEHYAGSHWLASFATYLETKRGIIVAE
ncbi:DUF2891 domain-containing protein [Sphingorhabdus sp. Alg239-R122]|uniref:DUF2891 domain-containing protein n=1 Tax=Sphingorhabdus sp. Alg239-R122 TaxID=2305989 RepID=UPI0013DA0204|nr:DUF2891 domain-containing protein [Sphingorhabdus sp. Alg239-R122]